MSFAGKLSRSLCPEALDSLNSITDASMELGKENFSFLMGTVPLFRAVLVKRVTWICR